MSGSRSDENGVSSDVLSHQTPPEAVPLTGLEQRPAPSDAAPFSVVTLAEELVAEIAPLEPVIAEALPEIVEEIAPVLLPELPALEVLAKAIATAIETPIPTPPEPSVRFDEGEALSVEDVAECPGSEDAADLAAVVSLEPDPVLLLEARLRAVEQAEERAQQRLRLAKAMEIVSHYTVWSGAAGLVPLPLVDLITITAVQVTMLHKVAKLYDTTLSRDRLYATIGILTSGVVASSTGSIVTASLSKTLPGWADYIGSTMTSCVAGSLTYALGRAFIVGFETEGHALRFDSEALRRHFLALFQAQERRRQAAV